MTERPEGSVAAQRLLGLATTDPIVAEGTVNEGHRWTLTLGPNADGGATANVCIEERDGGATTVGSGRYPQPDGTVLGGWGRSAHGHRRFFCWCTTLATTGIHLETANGRIGVTELAADTDLRVRVFLVVVDHPETTVKAAVHHTLDGAVEEDLTKAQAEFEAFRRRAFRRPPTTTDPD